MIKGRGTHQGRPLLVIGLTDENMRRLRQGGDEGLGEPIRFNTSELGLQPMTIVIMAGKSEEGIRAILAEFGFRLVFTED